MRLSKPSLTILLCTITLAILLCIPTNSLIPYKTSNTKENSPPTNEQKTLQHKKTNSFTILKHITTQESKTGIKEKKVSTTITALSINQNTRVSQYNGYDTQPSIATKNQQNILIAYAHKESNYNIYIQRSTDKGHTWSKTFYSTGPKELNHPFLKSNQTRPCLTITPNGYGFCVFESDDNTSRIYMLELPDINNEKTWFISWFNLSHLQSPKGYQYHIEEINYPAVSTSNDGKVIIACTADITNTTEGTTHYQMPLLLYSTDGGNDFTLIFSEDINYQYLSHTSLASDKGVYIVYQKGDEPATGIVCLYYPDGVISPNWMDFIPQTDNYNLMNPSVSTHGNKVFITAEKENNGEHDIIMMTSTNEGDHWNTLNIATTSGESERYPSIFFDGTMLICAFINTTTNNLYITTSQDLGLTWDNIKRVNSQQSTVFDSNHPIQLGGNNSITWVDVREGKPLIYYSNLESENPTPQPSINRDLSIKPDSVKIESIEGKVIKHMNNIVSVTVINQGEEKIKNVEVSLSIKVKGDVKLTHIASKTILYINPGEEKKIKLLMFSPVVADAAPALIEFAGINEIKVVVDPENKIPEKNENNNNFSLQCNYSDIFPRLSWLEDVILHFMEKSRGNNVSMLEDTLVQILQNNDNNRVKLIKTLLS